MSPVLFIVTPYLPDYVLQADHYGGKSVASFCCQIPDMFCNCLLLKNNKIAKNQTITKAREKISTDLESVCHCRQHFCLKNIASVHKF
jgi:hypothetical protein